VGKFSTTDLAPYCIAQILGGLVALEIYKRVRIIRLDIKMYEYILVDYTYIFKI